MLVLLLLHLFQVLVLSSSFLSRAKCKADIQPFGEVPLSNYLGKSCLFFWTKSYFSIFAIIFFHGPPKYFKYTFTFFVVHNCQLLDRLVYYVFLLQQTLVLPTLKKPTKPKNKTKKPQTTTDKTNKKTPYNIFHPNDLRQSTKEEHRLLKW